jgi:hypothetical protein
MATKSPTKVELVEDEQVTLTLSESGFGSLNDKKPYTGRADSAIIHGPAGSVVTFFDDKHFQEEENFVTVEKKVDGPVEVILNKDFVDASETEGERGYWSDQRPEYNWYFFRHKKPSWWDDVLDEAKKAAETAGKVAIAAAVTVLAEKLTKADLPSVKQLKKVEIDPPQTEPDENYSVNNCSSVRFGS